MRLFKILVKKGFRDIIKNLKQYIAIIFIIAISITLFVGLEANYLSFKGRVDNAYSPQNGNFADIWLTIDPSKTTQEESKNSELEYNTIKALSGDGAEVEKRLLVPSSVGKYSSYSLISYQRPKINKDYNTVFGKDDNSDYGNFFIVDKNLIKNYNESTSSQISVGDYLPVNFPSSYIKSSLEEIANNKDLILNTLENILSSTGTSQELKVIIINYAEENFDSLKKVLLDFLNSDYLSNDDLKLNIKVSGIMSHPENIQNSTFNPSFFLMGSKTFINSIVDNMLSSVTYDNLYNLVMNFEIPSFLKDQLLKYLEEYKDQIDTLIPLLNSFLQYEIMNDGSEDLTNLQKNFYNQYIIKLKNSKDIDLVSKNINNYFTNKGENNNLLSLMNQSNYPTNVIIQNDVIQANQLTYCFPVIFFVVAILVVLTTISQMILKERTQIGTLKAIGLSKIKILIYYICNINIISLIGIIVGLIIGPLLIPNVLNIKYEILYELPAIGYAFPLISSLIVVFGVLFLITLLLCLMIYKELRLRPSESMRPSSPKIEFKTRKHSIKNTSLMMAFRNIRVHITKSIMVIIGVMGCTGLLICGMGIEDTLNYGVDVDLTNFLNSDFTVSYLSEYKTDEVKNKLLSIENIDSVYEYNKSQVVASSLSKNISTEIYYFSKDVTNFKFDDNLKDGHWDLNSVAIDKARAEDFNLKVGDEISFTIDGTKYSKKISYIFYSFSCKGIFIYEETIPNLVSHMNNAWVNVKKDSNGAWLENESILKDAILKNEEIQSASSLSENVTKINSYMSSISGMTNTIKIFAILLAVIVLINLAILNFQERLREIATLKVLGFSKREISTSLVYEVMMLTIIGSLLGLVLGKPLEMLVLSVNKVELISWHYTVSYTTYLIAFAISILTALIVNILLSSRIDKVKMSESLKSVE